MTTPEVIKKLAWERLAEAQILFKHGKCDTSFYLAGYSVELMLKAKICERLGIPNLFDEKSTIANQINNIGEIRKSVKTHNLFTLLIFSGLKIKFDTDKAKDKNLTKANSLLFSSWDENARYKPCGTMKPKDVQILLNLLADILKWIERN
jgi:hypothetical protein